MGARFRERKKGGKKRVLGEDGKGEGVRRVKDRIDKRENKKERERDRETERQRDRERQRQRHRDRETEKKTDKKETLVLFYVRLLNLSLMLFFT
jgi:ATP-dependent RNA helicase DDX46/PRP5